MPEAEKSGPGRNPCESRRSAMDGFFSLI